MARRAKATERNAFEYVNKVGDLGGWRIDAATLDAIVVIYNAFLKERDSGIFSSAKRNAPTRKIVPMSSCQELDVASGAAQGDKCHLETVDLLRHLGQSRCSCPPEYLLFQLYSLLSKKKSYFILCILMHLMHPRGDEPVRSAAGWQGLQPQAELQPQAAITDLVGVGATTCGNSDSAFSEKHSALQHSNSLLASD